jgi:hypothetical protein
VDQFLCNEAEKYSGNEKNNYTDEFRPFGRVVPSAAFSFHLTRGEPAADGNSTTKR